MQNLKNNITLVGNMGQNIHITNFTNGSKVARFSLATDQSRKKINGTIETIANWHNLFAWGNMAQFIEHYGQKGKRLAVHGRLVQRTLLSKTGKKQNITEVEVKHIIEL